ncbi:hypothetical protein HII31_09057 [Pseudocercospora fuligena]|uniref:Uncharacterized protein n=1 Tax=Pseudocercospora fuligena TaxID=685502 RepID=A0A8H6VEP6_9PEZI|nr:hypothetical protein HII31_09057 [Pseudocercospora fuligena]
MSPDKDMATDPYKYRCTPREAEELHTSRVLGLNIWRSGPVPENVRQLPASQANVVPFDRMYAVRMLDDDDGNARWTSEDAIYLHRVLNLPPPRLHPAAEPLGSILNRMNGYDRSRIHGINTTYLPRTIQPRRPAEAGRMSEAIEAKFDPARGATIESALQALREQERPDQAPISPQQSSSSTASPQQQNSSAVDGSAPGDGSLDGTVIAEVPTAAGRSRMSIANLLAPTDSDKVSAEDIQNPSVRSQSRSTASYSQASLDINEQPAATQLGQRSQGSPLQQEQHGSSRLPSTPHLDIIRPQQGMQPPSMPASFCQPVQNMPSAYPRTPAYPSHPPPPGNSTPLRQISYASNPNGSVPSFSSPVGSSQVNRGRVTKPSSLRPRGGGMSPARQDVFNRFFEEQKKREAADTPPPPPPPRMSELYAPPGAQAATSPASSTPAQASRPGTEGGRLGVADGVSLANAGMQSNSSSVWEEGEQDPKLKNGRLNDVTDPEYEAVIDDDEPEY